MAEEVNRRHVLLALGGSGALVAAAVAGLGTTSRSGSGAVTRGRGAWTTFGSVAVLGSTLWRAAPGGHHAADSGGQRAHDHGDHDHAGIHASPPTAHGSWQDTVIVDVEVHNGTGQPIWASPGQFRLRVDEGPSVSFYDTERGPLALAAGTAITSRISYLVPPGVRALTVEFADPEDGAPLAFTLHPTSPQGVT